MVIAYAERIECFVKYLKNQQKSNSLEIDGREEPPQPHYSIKMDVTLDDKSETVEIIYVKYQDKDKDKGNGAFGGLTAGDAEYAFIGGDLCDKEDVRQFLENCGVLQEHTFVTPCAYNIDAAGASGETDCQKRKFKKSIFKRLSNVTFTSDEKTPITADKNLFKYNVDFFNAIVQNNETKQCVARPFIMLQFPLFICWSYEYSQGGAQNIIETTTQKLIKMFESSSRISNSLLESLRIPATHMFENKPDVVVAPVDENMAQVPSQVERNNFDLGSNTVPATGEQYKIDTTTINKAVISPSAPTKMYKIEKINDTQIKLMIITQGNIKTEKIFNRGETYKTTNSAKLYKFCAITEARATFKITNAGEKDVIEIIVFGELGPAPVVTDIYNKPKDNPIITMDLLENLEKNERPSPPPSNAEPTTTTTEDPKDIIKRLIETDPLTYQNTQDAIGVLNTMTLDSAQQSIKNIAMMYYIRLEEPEQNQNNDADKTKLLKDIKGLMMMIVNPTPIPAQPSAQPYKINISDDLKSFTITDNADGSNNTIMFEVGKTYIFKNVPNTFSPYSGRSFKLESIAQNDVDGASEKMIKFIDSGVGKLSEYKIYVDANGVPKMGDKIQIGQILFLPALFKLTEMSEVALKFMTQAQPATTIFTTPTVTFSRANLGVSSPRSETEALGTAAVEETKGEQPIDNTDVNNKTVQSIGLYIAEKDNFKVGVSMFTSYCNSILDFPDDGNKLDDFYILSALADERTDFKIIDMIAENSKQLDRLSKHVFHKVDSMSPNGITLVSVQPSDLLDKKEDITIASETFYKYNDLYSFKLKNVDTNQITLEIFLSGDQTAFKQEYKINLNDGFMLEYNYQLLSRLYENNKNKNGPSVSAPEPASINFESVVPEQDSTSDLVGFGSKMNNNNCYLNAMFQMLCRVKGLKQELIEKLDATEIAKTKKSVNGNVQVEYNNPTYEIATIFKKYDDASKQSFRKKMATSVNVETEDVLGMKGFVSNAVEASRDTQHSIIEFLIKGVFCEDNDDNCEFAKHLYTNKHDFFAATLKCINKDDEFQLLEDERSIADEDKQRIQDQNKDNVIFHFNRVGEQVIGEDGKITIPKIQTSLIAPNTLKIGESTYLKKGAIVHLGTGSGSGHYLYISYKTFPDGRVVIDKIYNNENILVFNNNAGKPYLAKSQSQSSEGILVFFLDSITAIIDDVTAQQKDNKNIFIPKLVEAASEIIDSDILSLAQYDDVNNKLDVIRLNIQFNFDIFCNVPKEQIVAIFKYSQFNEILNKDINQIDEEVSRNATYFLYELDTVSVGGAIKKKSWSRSRRAKKHTNTSLKRLNKMKRESHPSIKKRTTSLKK